MKYFLTPRAFGTVADTSVSRLWQRTFIKSLAVRVVEEDGLPVTVKLEIPTMLDIGLAM
jgi:hypothetical protein